MLKIDTQIERLENYMETINLIWSGSGLHTH